VSKTAPRKNRRSTSLHGTKFNGEERERSSKFRQQRKREREKMVEI